MGEYARNFIRTTIILCTGLAIVLMGFGVSRKPSRKPESNLSGIGEGQAVRVKELIRANEPALRERRSTRSVETVEPPPPVVQSPDPIMGGDPWGRRW